MNGVLVNPFPYISSVELESLDEKMGVREINLTKQLRGYKNKQIALSIIAIGTLAIGIIIGQPWIIVGSAIPLALSFYSYYKKGKTFELIEIVKLDKKELKFHRTTFAICKEWLENTKISGRLDQNHDEIRQELQSLVDKFDWQIVRPHVEGCHIDMTVTTKTGKDSKVYDTIHLKKIRSTLANCLNNLQLATKTKEEKDSAEIGTLLAKSLVGLKKSIETQLKTTVALTNQLYGQYHLSK